MSQVRKQQYGSRPRRAAATVTFHVVSSIIAIAFVFPIVWAIINSIKPPAEANQAPPSFLPSALSLENFTNLLTYGEGLLTYTANSFAVSAMTVFGTLLVCALGGYGFARFNFPGKRILFILVLTILMVPHVTLLLPLYVWLNKLALLDSLFGLSFALILLQLPFGLLMMRISFESVPRELEEAALVDGCSNLGALLRISLRLVAPALVTVGLIAFLASWNEFIAPLIFIADGSKFTLPVMLVNVRSGAYGAVDYGALQAGVVVTMIPCLLLYLFLQRFYERGLTSGALRG